METPESYFQQFHQAFITHKNLITYVSCILNAASPEEMFPRGCAMYESWCAVASVACFASAVARDKSVCFAQAGAAEWLRV